MIYLIDKIKQKNDGDFYLADAADIECDDGTSLQEKLNTLESGSGAADVATDDEVEEMLSEIYGSDTTE